MTDQELAALRHHGFGVAYRMLGMFAIASINVWNRVAVAARSVPASYGQPAAA